MKHYEYEINRFIDHQLKEEEQKELFAHLANCSDCAALLNDYMEIKEKANNFYKGLRYEPGERKLAFSYEKKSKYKYGFYFSAAAAIILGFLFLLGLHNKNSNEQKYSQLNAKFITLEKSFKSLTENQTGDKASIKENEIKNSFKNKLRNESAVIKKKGNAIRQETSHKNNEAKYVSYKKRKTRFDYLDYIDSLPAKHITSDDFLTAQIIGN